MKTTNWIIGLVLMLFTFSVQAQNESVEKEGQSTDQNASGNQNSQDEQQGTRDANVEPGTGNNAAANANEADTTTEVSNVPAVPQTTSSSSGSPAVLAGDDGEERDGTNSVQRASMNMVGSPAANLNLSEGQAVDADTELSDRQERAQEKQVSAQVRGQGDNTASESSEINTNTRKENNALSDQNLSSKDKDNQRAAEEEKKKDKQKRKKDRG